MAWGSVIHTFEKTDCKRSEGKAMSAELEKHMDAYSVCQVGNRTSQSVCSALVRKFVQCRPVGKV